MCGILAPVLVAATGIDQMAEVKLVDALVVAELDNVGQGFVRALRQAETQANFDAAFLQLALGVFVLGLGSYQLLGLPAIQTTRMAAVPYGVLGGLVGTLFGTGGPFYVLYLGMRGLKKASIRASFAMWFVIDGAIRLTGYTAAGIANMETLRALALALPVAAVALFVGGRIQLGFSQEAFRKFVSVLLVLSGIALILK